MYSSYTHHAIKALLCLTLIFASVSMLHAQDNAEDDVAVDTNAPDGTVYCANLTYADEKTSVCFSDQFLKEVREETNINAYPSFEDVRLDSAELFDYPFVVMTGEGKFTINDQQLTNLRDYLDSGGFLLASAGCSSKPWNTSFGRVMRKAYPDAELIRLQSDHPIYHSVYDIEQSRYKSGGPRLPVLDALEIDGRVVMVWSPDGLNDTANAGPECCCCGGNEVKSARKLNVNILAYALTH